jgi:hypothetical protein
VRKRDEEKKNEERVREKDWKEGAWPVLCGAGCVSLPEVYKYLPRKRKKERGREREWEWECSPDEFFFSIVF